MRVRDADILTVDRYTFVGDERFESHYSAPTETWNLVIRYVQERDAGEYECQVSTEPKMSQFFSLRVVSKLLILLLMSLDPFFYYCFCCGIGWGEVEYGVMLCREGVLCGVCVLCKAYV